MTTETEAPADRPRSALFLRVASGLVLAPVVAALIVINNWTFTLLILAALVISLKEWLGMAKAARHRYIFSGIGVVYLAATFAAYVDLRFVPHGRGLALTAVLAVWASDIGAYFTGRTFKGPKLVPVISPNKTWSGFAGAMIFPGLLLVLLIACDHRSKSYFGTIIPFDAAHLAMVFLCGCGLGAAGQAGDLFISWFKRKGGLKDTGQLIPGHGGLLDRIDSLLLMAPVFLLMTMLWRHKL